MRDQKHGQRLPEDRGGKYGRSGRSGRYKIHDSGFTVERRRVTEDRRNDSHARDGLDSVLMLVELGWRCKWGRVRDASGNHVT